MKSRVSVLSKEVSGRGGFGRTTTVLVSATSDWKMQPEGVEPLLNQRLFLLSNFDLIGKFVILFSTTLVHVG